MGLTQMSQVQVHRAAIRLDRYVMAARERGAFGNQKRNRVGQTGLGRRSSACAVLRAHWLTAGLVMTRDVDQAARRRQAIFAAPILNLNRLAHGALVSVGRNCQ